MKKKILFLIPSLVGGGAERTLINLLNKLDYSRYDVDLVVVSNNGIYLDQVPKEVKLISLFNSDFLVRILAFLQKKYNFDQILKWRIQNRVQKDYDVGISFLDSNFTELLFFLENVKKTISWVHGSYITNQNFARFFKNETYFNRVKKHRYDKLDHIVFVSKDTKAEFIELFGEYVNVSVIYNVIDDQMITSKAEEWKPETNHRFNFFALGSLLRVKGFDRLIRACKILKDADLSFQLQIAGKGPEKQRLLQLITDLDLSNEISLIGFQANPYPLLKGCDAFVLSSISEALPTVICEAMILGKPIISTNCSGASELLDDNRFGLIAQQDDQDLADKMKRFILEPETVKSYAAKSLERGKDFDDEETLKAYYSIFDL